MRTHSITLIIFTIAVIGCGQHPSKDETKIPVVLQEYIENPQTARITDFSYAGYFQGDSFPSFKPKDYPVFNVTDYGAVPDDGKDDINAIQRAINDAEKAGKGVVRFPPGVFDFDVKTAQRFLEIKSSNIILLGGGPAADGTTLHDHSPSRTPVAGKLWLAGVYPGVVKVGKTSLLGEENPFDFPENKLATLGNASMNSHTVSCMNPENLEVGEHYLLTLEEDIDTSLLKSMISPLKKVARNYAVIDEKSKYRVRFWVTIDNIEGNQLTFTSPLLWELKEKWNPTLWKVPWMIQNVHIAGFHLKSDWNEEFHHHLSDIHDNGWDHIKYRWAVNCMVKDVHHENTSSAISLSSCYQVSVIDCRISGNPGHNGFVIGGNSTRNLMYNLQSGSNFHTFGISGNSSGNVFFNCYAEAPSAIDCHGSIAIMNLFDNIYGCTWKHGGSGSAFPPAHARGLVLWNWNMGVSEPYHTRVKPEITKFNEIPGFIAVGVKGLHGQKIYFMDELKIPVFSDTTNQWGTIEDLNAEVEPWSLYSYQMKKRSGRYFPKE